MSRVKRALVTQRKHKKLLNLAKGYRGARSRLVKRAHEAVLHAGEYAFSGRKLKKRDMRSLWITRIGYAAKQLGTSYNTLIHHLNQKKIGLNRKMLNELVTQDFETFKKVVEKAQA